MTLVVATTLHAYCTDQEDTSLAWLYHAEAIAASHPDGVTFFAALELDARGIAPFAPLLDRMAQIEAETGAPVAHWTFSFDDGADEITTGNRLRRITMGQNMASRFAMDVGATHMLFCAADCAPPGDVLPKLLEMEHPIVGPEITTYCLHGPVPQKLRQPEVGDEVKSGRGRPGRVVEVAEDGYWRVEGMDMHDGLRSPRPIKAPSGPDVTLVDRDEVDLFPFPVEEHMASAACILLARDVFVQCPWRCDKDRNLTDDPAMHADALRLGWPTYVRKDCRAQHYPDAIGPIEDRHADRKIRR